MPRLSVEAAANLHKAREAAVLAVETYNRPGTAFRSAAYIVLMIIAWTALFHAIFGKRKVRPYYRKKGSRRFERIDGDYLNVVGLPVAALLELEPALIGSYRWGKCLSGSHSRGVE